MDSRNVQLDQYKQAFNRYFLAGGVNRGSGFGFGGFFGFGGGSSGERNVVNEIVEGRVFLSNLPSKTPFSHYANLALEDDSALVVSCVDMSELAKSTLLLEPMSGKVRYHVLPMRDVVAEVGHQDQIFDTLALMSSFADRGMPIHIHCMHGVGRSAMMTALHIAHRYLLNDPVITARINKFAWNKKLDPESETFIRELYDLVSNFVLSKRLCCQFYDETRNRLAREVLTTIQRRIQLQQSIVNEHDVNYQFLTALTVSAEFKRLMHDICNGSSSQIHCYNQFANMLLANTANWYQQLCEVVDGETVEGKPENVLVQSYQPEMASQSRLAAREEDNNARRLLFADFKAAVDRIALKFPEAQYSQSVTATLRQESTLTI